MKIEMVKEICRKLKKLLVEMDKERDDKVTIQNIPVEHLRVAVQELEKQIPKKATDIRYFGEAGYYIGLCPCCKSGNNSEFQYCGDCGQAIDWSGENVN